MHASQDKKHVQDWRIVNATLLQTKSDLRVATPSVKLSLIKAVTHEAHC